MEFRLKEGWTDYFLSGFLIGILFAVLFAMYLFQGYFQIDSGNLLQITGLIMVLVVVSVFSFVIGCRVKRK